MDRREWWSVLIEFGASEVGHGRNLDDEHLDRLVGALEAHDGVVSFAPGRLAVRLSVQHDRHEGALGHASEITMKALADVGLLDLPVVRVEAVRQSQLAREIAEPSQPQVLGVAEVAALLGVSRQRLAVIRREHESFPEPFATLAATPLWYCSAIEQWLKSWPRRPGSRGSAALLGATTAAVFMMAADPGAIESLTKALAILGGVTLVGIGVVKLARGLPGAGSLQGALSAPALVGS